ncbi:glutathione S-transferase domain-containing protein [Periconia macrospinosa]|uniref:glutathione transferase n=1 Tax=Periconia macrospinosa TaxID=97972 RepID=A0A2V1E7Z8_9PLEO|nr:glutathione S-transferase domain-containing protein [Periconia macrospinosa]
MPAFTLYGFHGSTMTNRVRMTLAEGGFTDYEFVVVNLPKGEQRSKDHLERHPWGRVPVLQYPGGFTLYESQAICKYLATKYSFPLLPPQSDVEGTALFEQATSVERSYFSSPAGNIAFENFVKVRMLKLPPDEKVISDSVKSLNDFFDVAEDILSKNEYMAGKAFSLVDIYYIPVIHRLIDCGVGDLITSRKAVSAWWDRCNSRPAIKASVAAEKETLAAMLKG